jgi:hypothetical protein
MLYPLLAELRPLTLEPRSLQRLRVRRWVELVALVVGVTVAIASVHDAIYGVRIRASSELGPPWTADRAIDGDSTTDWVSGGGDGWVELRFPGKRQLNHLRMMNGQFFPDRASKDIRVELYDGDTVANAVMASFAHDAQTLTLDLGNVRADRVRITVLSHLGTSAAIAEITWD